MKNLNDVNSSNVMNSWLPQLKSYLKILGILYLVEDTNLLVTYEIIEKVLETIHIFNDVVLASQQCVIKAFPKSDIVIIWINIWNFQNNTKGKILINRCFNISQHITTIRGTNINSNIFQYKNCWKWEHITFICCIHRFKCQKYNVPHKIKYYRDIV